MAKKKMEVKSKTSTLTLRLDPEATAALDRYKDLHGMATSSKAIQHMIRYAEIYQRDMARLVDSLDQVETQRDRLLQVLESARASAAQLLEVAGQSDMFSDA